MMCKLYYVFYTNTIEPHEESIDRFHNQGIRGIDLRNSYIIFNDCFYFLLN
jgi:hypothetical protein